MSGVDDLVAFLRARLDEDEASVYAWDSDAEACVGTVWTGNEPGYTTVASRRGEGPWIADGREVLNARHGRVLYDPARVLREVEAKRRIVDDVVPEVEGAEDRIDGEWGVVSLPWDQVHATTLSLLRLLALPYSDHPDYRPEWKPQ